MTGSASLRWRLLRHLLLVLLLVGGVQGADVPCYFDGSDFQKMEVIEPSEDVPDEVSFAGPSRDYATSGVPAISVPTKNVRSVIENVTKAVDPGETIVHNKAIELSAISPGPTNIGQICQIDTYLRDNWHYVSDPRGTETFSSGTNTIELAESISKRLEKTVAGAGDCDDYAILMASLIESIGGTTRIVLAYGKDQGHAYTEIYLGSTSDKRTRSVVRWLKSRYKCDEITGHLTEEDGGFWLNLDYNGTHPGGPLYRSEVQSIAYIGEGLKRTEVGLPPDYDIPGETGTLAGTVTDETGNPIACTVVANETEGVKAYPCSVDNSGRFKLDLPPGSYLITAEKPGYAFPEEERLILEETTVSLDITGRVVRRPNVQFNVEAVDPVKRTVYYTRDAEGRQVFKIRFYVIGPDLYRIKSVKYSLHETFEKPEHVSTDASRNFEMVAWLWGRFAMPIIVTTKDGNEYEYMYAFTFRSQLEDAQRRGYRFIDATGAWDVIGGY